MTDFRIKVFACVARELSFTKASRELHISQPAISKHIQELELVYGVQLFERSGGGVKLTVAGDRLKNIASDLLAKYNEIEVEMGLLKGVFKGELKIGASSSIAQYVIPQILAKFIVRFPDVKINLISGNSEQIEDALEKGKIDLGLVEGESKKREFHYQHFAKDELVLVTSVKTKVTQEIDFETLKKVPLVLRESGSGTLEVIEKALNEHNLKFSHMNIVIQLGSTESIKQFLDNSSAFAFISVAAVAKDLLNNRLKIIDVKNMEILREFSFITIMGKHTDAVDRFIEFSKLHHNKKL